MYIWIKNDKISLWETEVFYLSRKSDLLNNIGEKLSNININIENIDLNALVEWKEELLNISDERHQSHTIHSMIDIFTIPFFAILSDCDEWVQIKMFARKQLWLV